MLRLSPRHLPPPPFWNPSHDPLRNFPHRYFTCFDTIHAKLEFTFLNFFHPFRHRFRCPGMPVHCNPSRALREKPWPSNGYSFCLDQFYGDTVHISVADLFRCYWLEKNVFRTLVARGRLCCLCNCLSQCGFRQKDISTIGEGEWGNILYNESCLTHAVIGQLQCLRQIV